MVGTIIAVKERRGFGFVRSGKVDHFFHRRDLAPGLEFDCQLLQRSVRFDVEQTDKGPEARNLRPL